MPTTSRLTRAQRVRRLGNLVNLSTPLGLLIGRVGRAQPGADSQGLHLLENYTLTFPPAGAFTVGNVVISPLTFAELTAMQPDVLDHEEAHAWQYFWCCGLPFLPLYAAAAGWSWLRTGDVASANFFERNAGLQRGGYRKAPITNIGFRRLAVRVQTLMVKPSRLAERSR